MRQKLTYPKFKINFRAFCTKNPAVIPMVVGKLAAHTPYLLIVPSVFSVTAKGDAQIKHPLCPGIIT